MTGASLSEALTINAPVLSDCPVNIECEIVDSIRTGSHEMFVGKILHVHAEESIVAPDLARRVAPRAECSVFEVGPLIGKICNALLKHTAAAG